MQRSLMHVAAPDVAIDDYIHVKIAFCIVALFIATASFGQVCKPVAQQQSLVIELGLSDKATYELNRHIKSLSKIKLKSKKDTSLVARVFHKTQSRFFHSYEQYAQFDELFDAGKYNCLTGTILFAHIYQSLGFEVDIFETRFHSFVIVKTNSERVLLETTDRLNGIVNGSEKIDERIQTYLEKEIKQLKEPSSIPLDSYLPIREISFRQLIGLHYLNRAVVKINGSNLKRAASELLKAQTFYPESDRIADLYYVVRSQCDAAPLSGTAITTEDLKEN